LILPFDDDSPLRRELFSVEQLERHAHRLAREHAVKAGRRQTRLIDRLRDNEGALILVYDQLTVAVQKELRIAPAGEWLLDNFYVIEDQIRSIRLHLPRSYSRSLPALADGPAAGLPRVYAMV
jgi:hypothetical protein